MEKRYDKGQIETVVLQAVLARPYKEFGGCRIYPLHAEGEEAVVKNLAGSREVTTLAELEDAVNAPEVANVFIGRFAAVTSKGMKTSCPERRWQKIFSARLKSGNKKNGGGDETGNNQSAKPSALQRHAAGAPQVRRSVDAGFLPRDSDVVR